LSSYFRSGLLETLGDGLLYSSQYFLGVTKLHVFRKKILSTFGDAIRMQQCGVPEGVKW
jgi:hypothetical protein